jgi:ethanolamine permease
VPLFPYFPAVALCIAFVALVAMIWYNGQLALIYGGLILVSFISYRLFRQIAGNK